MHFSKEYAILLSELPSELRENAINYRQLKKVINQLVAELKSHGLGPTILHTRTDEEPSEAISDNKRAKEDWISDNAPDNLFSLTPDLRLLYTPFRSSSRSPEIVYELSGCMDAPIQPRLHLWMPITNGDIAESSEDVSQSITNSGMPHPRFRIRSTSSTTTPTSLSWKLGSSAKLRDPLNWVSVDSPGVAQPLEHTHLNAKYKEIIIPLASDFAFFTILTTALDTLSSQNPSIHAHFTEALQQLSISISRSARPISSSRNSSFSRSVFHREDSDLYTWREVFTVYMELELFESTSEKNRGERDLFSTEKGLQVFVSRASVIGTKLSKEGRRSLERFIELNLYLLNVKKFYRANSEATRKILKKHAKRTSLPPLSLSSVAMLLPSLQESALALPHILVLALSDTLLPVIPHLHDYECLICTSIAFKPVRLNCGHFFCVRCLAKMQKARKNNCPMCRASTVITANKDNVDHALLRFMLDWFPREAKEKNSSNERESAEEELEELGLRTDGCRIQ